MKEDKIGNSRVPGIFSSFLLRPLIYGLYGYTIFFLVIVVSKFAGYLLKTISAFNIDYSDLELSLMGFLLFLLIGVLKNFQGNNKF